MESAEGNGDQQSMFFEGDPETAAVNPANDQLMPDHVLSAATESWLSPADEQHFGEDFPALVADLEAAGQLDRRNTQHGLRWTYAGGESPQHQMDLRAIDDRQIQIRDRLGDETLASLSYDDALRDVHPNAIYYHQGEKYEVVDLDLDRNIAFLESTDLSYYTQALTDKAITINETIDETTLATHSGVTVGFADVDFREQVTKYLRCTRGNDNGEPIPLVKPLPPTALRTRALYFTIPPAIKQKLKAKTADEDGFEGAIHAVEHAMISLFPLEFLCDRRDIGGLSTPLHPETAKSTILIYDGYPGGVGVARGGYERVEDLLRETRELLADCPCESGCPACVQSPHCGNANDPLDKGLALSLLNLLLDNTDRNADQVTVDIGMDTESLASTEDESDTDASAERADHTEASGPTNNDTPVCAEADEEDTDHDSDSGSGSSSDPEERDQTSIAEQIAAQTGTNIGTVADALDALENYDVEPEVAKPSLLERYGADGSTIYGVSGVGRIRGHYLLEAGYETPEAIAAASVDDLMDVPYLAEATAPAVRDEAQKYVERAQGSEN